MKPTISCIKDEIAIVCTLLQRHHDNLGDKARSVFFAKSNHKSSKEMNVPAAFKKLKETIKLSNTEFHSSVDSTFRKRKNSPGRPSPFSVCINLSVKAAVDKLRGIDFYEPYFLTDKAMGIDGYAD